MKTTSALVIFLCFLASKARHPEPANPYPEPSYVKVYKGDSYDLLCSRNAFTTIKGCFLITPKGKIYAFWEGSNWENGRIKLTIEPTECKANIQNATMDDAGIWACHVSVQKDHESRDITKMIRVVVLPPPPPPPKQVINLENTFFLVS